MWCNPNGIKALSIIPKINVDIFVFTSLAKKDNFASPIWTGVFGGLIAGIIAAICYKKFYKTELPACSISVKCNLFPKAKNNPAAGRIATGVIRAFPIFWTYLYYLP